MTVGKRVKEVRKNAHISQKELAESLNISQTHISKVENEQDNLSNSLLKKISCIYNINYQWLKFGIGDMQNDVNTKENRNRLFLKLLTSDILSDLLQTHDSDELSKFSNMILYMSELFTDINIKNNSRLYYLDAVFNVIIYVRTYLKISSNDTNTVNASVQSEIVKSITENLDKAVQAFNDENLDKQLEE